jgi:hypothetical protein
LNAAGSLSGRTAAHGPSRDAALYQRPAIRTKTFPVATSRITLLSVLAMYIRAPLSSVCQDGLPSVEISSVGAVATTIFGGLAGAGVEEVSGGMSFAISAGGFSIRVHGPFASFAVYQSLPPLR